MNSLLNKAFGAFNLQKSTSLLSKIVDNGILSVTAIRTKKVKSGGSANNRRRTTPGKFRRLFVQDGEWVEADHLLVRQIGLQFYPGQNVVFTQNRSLKSLMPGHVVISLEKVSPYPDSKLYPYVAAGNVVERKFISIVSPQREGTYKLVEMV